MTTTSAAGKGDASPMAEGVPWGGASALAQILALAWVWE